MVDFRTVAGELAGPFAVGVVPSLAGDEQALGLEHGAALYFSPSTQSYLVAVFDLSPPGPGETAPDRPAAIRTFGQFRTIGVGHRLDLLGPDRVVDWVPGAATSEWRLYGYDPSITSGDPIPTRIAPPLPGGPATWRTIVAGHHLVLVRDDRVLDWVDDGTYRVFQRTDAAGVDPLPGPALVSGAWTDIGAGHELFQLPGGRVLDWIPAEGRFRVFAFDETAPGGDVLVRPPEIEGTAPGLAPDARLLPIGPNDEVIAWTPGGAYELRRIAARAAAADVTLRFLNEYGEPLPGLPFTVSDGLGVRPQQADAQGLAAVAGGGTASIQLDRAASAAALGDLLDRPWPPDNGPAGPLVAPGDSLDVVAADGSTLDVVVAARLAFEAELSAPVTGAVRVEGPGLRVSVEGGRLRVALQANGGVAAAALVDPVVEEVQPVQLGSLGAWVPPAGYVVQPDDSADSLSQAFVGEPGRFAEISDHDPVPGETLQLPPGLVPAWLALAGQQPPPPPLPQQWFQVVPDDLVAEFHAGTGGDALHALMDALDRPPAAGPDPGGELSRQAEAVTALAAVRPPLGPEQEPQEAPEPQDLPEGGFVA